MNLVLLFHFHTLRYLRLSQILGRTWFRLYRPRPDLRPAPPQRTTVGLPWIRMPLRRALMLSPTRLRLLNEEYEIQSAKDWCSPERKFLWTYNLHYFEDLFAEQAESRRDWHEKFMAKWIVENPPGRGLGWDPYPTSLRICNWIKWALAGNQLSPQALHSLAVQVRYLRKRHDSHLLGNHLLVNAKAFIFAGLFFDESEADGWYEKGLAILHRQIPEQILADGGHFERSPMYHNLIAEDLLDLMNILRVYRREGDFIWHKELDQMLHWAQAMRHPDGQIALFNDAAFEIAPTAAQLLEYAHRLGFSPARFDAGSDALLQPTGYIRACRGPAVLFADVALVGPDYLPGHGHADTLSFELSLHGWRIIVDSGTSIYQAGAERLRQRGTSAHNTVQVDGENSSEVWSSFRIARRAKITECIADSSPVFRLSAAHNGYRRLPQVGDHRRTFVLHQDHLDLEDEIDGSGEHEIRFALHLHPFCQANTLQNGQIEIKSQDPTQSLPRISYLKLDPKCSCQIIPSSYHPEFGLSFPNQKILGVYRGQLPVKFTTYLSWS